MEKYPTKTKRVLANQHGASAANPYATSVLGSGELQIRAQDPKQEPIRIRVQPHRLAVEFEFHGGLRGYFL